MNLALAVNPESFVYTDLRRLVELQYQARGFSFLPRQPVHSLLAGRHASRLRGRGLNFEEIRRYLPGDDIRQIDWKATVRTGKTQSRVYTEERPNGAMSNNVLERCERLAKHDCLVCIISDAFGHDADTQRHLTRISHHNDVLFVFVFDPLEAELPDAGALVFGDGARQIEVDTSDRGLRSEFRERFAAERATGRRFLLQRETIVLPLDTTKGVAAQLRRQLGARGK
jgi:uncharacterized protein (DUF58 family)